MPRNKLESGEDALGALLVWLHPDRDCAGTEYVRLHRRLSKMFEARGCTTPEDYTDETFNRVAQQLTEGKEIRTVNPTAYLYGVARFVLREQWNKPSPQNIEEVSPEKLTRNDLHEAEDREHKERRHTCLDECLSEVPLESRLLVLEYYAEEKTLKIDTRSRLAKRLGVASGVLRNRIFNLRNSLRSCVAACLAR